MISIHPDMLNIPFEEFKAFIEKVHPGENAEELWVANGGKMPKETKKKEG